MSTLNVNKFFKNYCKLYYNSYLVLKFAFGVCLVLTPNAKFTNSIMFAFSVDYTKSKI